MDWADMTNAQRADAVRLLAQTGRTRGEIAYELNSTAPAVGALALRADIRLRRKRRRPMWSPPPKNTAALAPHAEAWVPLPGSVPKTMMETGDNDCMWPVGDGKPEQMFCGLPQHEGRYCERHAAISRGYSFHAMPAVPFVFVPPDIEVDEALSTSPEDATIFLRGIKREVA